MTLQEILDPTTFAGIVISVDAAVYANFHMSQIGSWQLPACDGLANEYRLLVNEVMRLALDQELFTFVTSPPVCQPNGTVQPVSGTNNESERTLRGAAQARVAGRTNKTLAGARRQTIMTSVLESLRLYLQTFTLSRVVAEVQRWGSSGRSCFARLLRKLHLSLPESSILERVLPVPSG